MRTLRNTGMPSGRKVAATGSKLELQLKMQLDALGENYVREHKFAREVLDTNEKIREGLAKRGLKDWRFDFAYKTERVAVEVEGGVYTQGRHTRGEGFEEDCEKYNQATLLGWRVLRFTAKHIKNGSALGMIEKAIDNARLGRMEHYGGCGYSGR